MTIANSARRVVYVLDGVTTEFPVPFKFRENSHIRVVLASVAGVETVMTLGTHYTLSGAGNDAGGELTYLADQEVDATLVIKRVVPRIQETQYVPNDPFPAKAHEDALDGLTMMAQEAADEQARSVMVPETDTAIGSMVLPSLAQRALRAAGFDANGRPAVGPLLSALTALVAMSINPAFAQLAENIVYTANQPGAEAQSAAAVFGERISVKNFGAVGDGVTDDTVAIQKAIDSMTFGSTLYFPSTPYYAISLTGGSYIISDTLVIPRFARLSFKGDALGSCYIRFEDAGGKDIIYSGPGLDEPDNINGWTFEDLSFVSDTTTGHAINLQSVSRSNINRCYFDSIGGAALNAHCCIAMRFTNNWVSSCGYGILQATTLWTGLNGWDISGNYVALCAQWGMDIREAMTGTSITGNVFESNKVGGIHFAGNSHGIMVEGNYFENNHPTLDNANSTDIYLASGTFCTAISIRANYFNGSVRASDYYYPIRMGYARGCAIENNYLGTGSKFIKVETANNSGNRLGYVELWNGTYVPPYLTQATINFTTVSAKNFVNAGNRITHEFNPAAQPRYPINLVPGADLTTGWTATTGGTSTYTPASNGARTGYLLHRAGGAASITKTLTVGARENCDVKKRFVTFGIDVYVDSASSKAFTVSIDDTVATPDDITTSGVIADGYQTVFITITRDNPTGIRVTITADVDGDFHLCNERWVVTADPQAMR